MKYIIPFLLLFITFSINAEDPKNLRAGSFCAIDEESFELMMSILQAEDTDALVDMMVAQKVLLTENNKEVYVEEIEMGAVKVRPKGKAFTVWTTSDSLGEKSFFIPIKKKNFIRSIRKKYYLRMHELGYY